jgi:hypothetical protein
LANISSFDIAKLSGKVNKGLLATDSSGVASWQTWATFFDTYTDNLIIKLAKLAQDSATALQVITWDGTKWAAATPILTKYYDSPNGGALQAAGVEYSFNVTSTFGNGVIPKLVRPVVYCLADDGTTGFKAGDELEMHSFCNSAATSNKAFFTTRMNVSGSTVTITVAFLGTTALATALQAIKPGTPNTMVDLDLTKWSVRLRAFN